MCEFLIDSGTVYSVMPEVGNIYFEYPGNVRAAPVVFGEKGIYLLGATTIEAWGMFLDPIRRELRALPMVLM